MSTLFFPTSTYHRLSLVTLGRLSAWLLIVTAALSIRLYKLDQAHLEGNVTRQYHSLVIARDFYLQSIGGVPEWQKTISSLNRAHEGVLEPPIIEALTAFAYRLAGGEYLWIGSLFSVGFWMAGGLAVYILARKAASTDAAMLSTMFYYFLVSAITASRSFQPEALMMTAILFGIVAQVNYFTRATWRHLGAAAVLSSLALLVKPMSAFFLLGVFFSLYVYNYRARRQLRLWQAVVFLAITLLPTVIYYAAILFNADSQAQLVSGRFFPALWLRMTYWSGWLRLIGQEIGYNLLVLGLLGILLAKAGLFRWLLVGLWGGYLVYGLIFNFHISTHHYYHWPLMIVIAISLAPTAECLLARLRQLPRNVGVYAGCLLMIALSLFLSILDARQKTVSLDETVIDTAREIGAQVDHSASAVFLTPFYGMLLKYDGQIAGDAWPTVANLEEHQLRGERDMTPQERLASMNNPTYFIVTDWAELARQPELGQLLSHFRVLAETADYKIYDLSAAA